jgi:hypothetical protein
MNTIRQKYINYLISFVNIVVNEKQALALYR